MTLNPVFQFQLEIFDVHFPADHLCQFSLKSVHSLSNYYVHNLVTTDERDEWTIESICELRLI